MKFGWITEDIEEKFKSEIFVLDKDTINKKIIYQNMLQDINGTTQKNSPKVDRDLLFSKIIDFDLSEFDSPIYKLINYISSKLNNTNIIDLNYNEFVDKKDEDLSISLCKDFYKRNDKDSLNYFKKIIKKSNSIQFISDKEKNFLGRSYILSNDEYYILINGSNYLEDSISLIHETKHIEMAIKGYNSGIQLYMELPSILYELYMIDYLLCEDNNKEDILNLQMLTLNKYVNLIKSVNFQIDLIKKIKSNDDITNTYQNLYENYDLYYDEYNLFELYSIVNKGFSQKKIGQIVSFIVALDIYLNGKMGNVNNILSLYMFGFYKLKPDIVDKVLEYINSMYIPFAEDKYNKKIKKIEK